MIKNNAKTIAILMATYNGEKYVEEMLRSLEKQTEDDFFCYIHDRPDDAYSQKVGGRSSVSLYDP